jgi:hypothetical protein
MFYTFIILFEKIKDSDRPYGSLQRFYYKRRKVTNLALMGWGCYTSTPWRSNERKDEGAVFKSKTEPPKRRDEIPSVNKGKTES